MEHSAAQEMAELSWALWALGLAAGVWLAGVLLFAWGPNHWGVTGRIGAYGVPFRAWSYVLHLLAPSTSLHLQGVFVPSRLAPWGWLYKDVAVLVALTGWLLTIVLVGAALHWLVASEARKIREGFGPDS